MQDLRKTVLTNTLAFLAVLLLLILLPAWSLAYWQAWLYWVVFSAWTLFTSLYFLKHDPALMERRARGGPGAEKEKTQKAIQTVTSVFFIILYLVAGLDHRFGWSDISLAVVIASQGLAALGYLIIFLTLKANTFASATIEIAEDQKVISTGPYRFVRHPMYAGAVLLIGFTPPALGSLWALIGALGGIGGIVWRLIDEEKFLAKNLPGYTEYCQQVRYRLIPFIW